jgi:hypothetical protein
MWVRGVWPDNDSGWCYEVVSTKDRLPQVLWVNENEEVLPTIKWTNSKLGDGFDKSPQVMEDGDEIFGKSDIRQDRERLKTKVQDSTCGAELSWWLFLF